MALRNRPLPTDIYEGWNSFLPLDGSAYVYGTSAEERSAHPSDWEARCSNVKFVRVTERNSSEVSVDLGVAASSDGNVQLRSKEQLRRFWNDVGAESVYLDITGLSHHVWAPLLRSALTTGSNLKAVYVEPFDYRFSPTPTEGEIFDLSERIIGISPIPGFASLTETDDDDVCFVPLLGFEGTRLQYLVEQVQPPAEKIVPIIGIPGFRAEYPFYTYQGNQSALRDTKAWKNVRFAAANCPFSLFYALEDIAKEYPLDLLKVAPIGTKPHALGAVLYNLASFRPVELVYDHPIRKPTRTAGSARLLVYHLSSLSLNIRE